MAEETPRPPMADEPDDEDRPGVVPGSARPQPPGSEPEEEEKFSFPSEPLVIVEVAPPVTGIFGESDPGKTVEVAPDDPAERRPGPDHPIAEIKPPQPDPYEPGPLPEVRPPDPDRPPSEVQPEVAPEVIPEVAPEVITEVAPEVSPSETEPTRPVDPSEVITEVAPEVSPER